MLILDVNTNVNWYLQMLFPGLWLTEVNAETYKVPDVPDTGKVITPSSQF